MPLIVLVNMHGLLLYKTKKWVFIVNAFQSISDSSKRKWNKIRVDQGSELYYSEKIVKRESHRNGFNIQWKKICCRWKIY